MTIEELKAKLQDVIAQMAEANAKTAELQTVVTQFEDNLEELGKPLIEAKKAADEALANYQDELAKYNKADEERMNALSQLGIIQRTLSDLEAEKQDLIGNIEATEKANEEQKQAIIEQLKEMTEGK